MQVLFKGRGLSPSRCTGYYSVIAYYSFVAVLFFIIFLVKHVSSATKLLVVGKKARLHFTSTVYTQHNVP